jgi:hypothetical protein
MIRRRPALASGRLAGLVVSCLAVIATSAPLVPAHAQSAPAGGAAAAAGRIGPVAPETAPAASGLSLEALLKKIGGKPRQEVRFVEKKYLAVLDAPVESSGVLRYQAPGRLEKNTEKPVRESMMLDGDLLVMQREGRRRSLPAAQLPGVAALVGGLRDVLGGNAQALHRMFKVVVQGDPQRWQVDLLPATVTSAQLVSRITLRGRQDRLEEVETLQADGDRSVMTLSPP